MSPRCAQSDLDRDEHDQFEGRDLPGNQETARGTRGQFVVSVDQRDIQMTLVTPANATGPVPVMMMFGGAAFPSGWPIWPPAVPNEGGRWGAIRLQPNS